MAGEAHMAGPLVLKFGGSVLAGESDLGWVAACVEAERARAEAGRGCVVVVSAFGATTDDLLSRAARQAVDHGAAEHVARLAATGEEGASALFAMALEAAGHTPVLIGPRELGIRTTGELLDAAPIGFDGAAIEAGLARTGLVVVPGFVGFHHGGHLSLLGRGGSDLTALFLAHHLRATRCILLKDVKGLFDADPKTSPSPRRFDELTHAAAAACAGPAVQPKALAFAERVGLAFELGRPDCPDSRTRIVSGG
jgi:homoserine dehydrogenase